MTRRASIVALGAAAAVAALPPSSLARQRSPDGTVVGDLAYGEVLFDFYQEDYLPALTRLLAAEQRGELKVNGDEAELLLGGLYLSYGAHELAGSIFERLLDKSADESVRNRAWYFLAKIRYQRGYLPEAEAALARIKGELPENLEPERRMLSAQVLMDQGRFEDARALLASWRKPDEQWLGYAKYNLGVALVRLGRVADGAKILGEVGALETSNPELLSLRDKANVALGYAWLQAGSPAEAKPALGRVRLDGPFSSKALLGAGWADAELSNYRAALTPWTELGSRSLLDSAVQESLLAVPYAFAQLGADRQAADRYGSAIDTFDTEIARIDRIIDDVRTGGLIERLLGAGQTRADGWYWRLEGLPDTDESRYLYELMSTNRFQEALKNYRDLAYLLANLDRWADSLGAFYDILDTKQRAYDQRRPLIDASLEQVDLGEMAERRLALESRLKTIERTNDSVALGTEKQQLEWQKLSAMEGSLALLPQDDRGTELRDKQRFLKGLLQWDLDRDYKARLWAEKKSLKQLDLELKEAQRRRHEVAAGRDAWPDQFAALTARIDGLEPRVDALRTQVRAALARQQAFVAALATEDLEAQRARLDAYRVQARFSLAAIYDRASAKPAAGEASSSAGGAAGAAGLTGSTGAGATGPANAPAAGKSGLTPISGARAAAEARE
ncbi:MAG TPA: hypothetical protein VFV10_01335 [Gammaproteobacteria bacterium]|nr:hypothetical protein [Gammaproteobacteria bacterium]